MMPLDDDDDEEEEEDDYDDDRFQYCILQVNEKDVAPRWRREGSVQSGNSPRVFLCVLVGFNCELLRC